VRGAQSKMRDVNAILVNDGQNDVALFYGLRQGGGGGVHLSKMIFLLVRSTIYCFYFTCNTEAIDFRRRYLVQRAKLFLFLYRNILILSYLKDRYTTFVA
jgi:hypothetical protein